MADLLLHGFTSDAPRARTPGTLQATHPATPVGKPNRLTGQTPSAATAGSTEAPRTVVPGWEDGRVSARHLQTTDSRSRAFRSSRPRWRRAPDESAVTTIFYLVLTVLYHFAKNYWLKSV